MSWYESSYLFLLGLTIHQSVWNGLDKEVLDHLPTQVQSTVRSTRQHDPEVFYVLRDFGIVQDLKEKRIT